MQNYIKRAKRSAAEQRRLFLLSFFTEEKGYDEVEVNGWHLVKHFDGNTRKWTVNIYSKVSYKKYAGGQSAYQKNKDGYLDEAFHTAILKEE